MRGASFEVVTVFVLLLFTNLCTCTGKLLLTFYDIKVKGWGSLMQVFLNIGVLIIGIKQNKPCCLPHREMDILEYSCKYLALTCFQLSVSSDIFRSECHAGMQRAVKQLWLLDFCHHIGMWARQQDYKPSELTFWMTHFHLEKKNALLSPKTENSLISTKQPRSR